MDTQYQTQSIDWGAVINNTVNQVPGWIVLARQPQNGSTSSVVVGPRTVSASISPTLLIVAAAIVLVVVLK